MFKLLIYRSVWLPVAITASLLLLTLVLLINTAQRSLDRLYPIESHLLGFTEVQEVLIQVQGALLSHISEGGEISEEDLAALRRKIGDVLEKGREEGRMADSAAMQRAYDLLAEPGQMPIPALARVINQLNHVVDSETRAHNRLISSAREAARQELNIATATLIMLPLLGGALLFLVRKRIFTPLDELGWLMSQLARRDYAPAPSRNVDPLLRPLIGHYNTMVERLAELEREHAMRHDSLESQVRSAAGHLLDQQRSLADAQRLAAVGELAAQLAHELRNPLAGIQMALLNLRQEVSDPEHVERLQMVSHELQRITALLNSLLEQARQRPEPVSDVPLAEVTDEIFTLARYQLPEQITLRHEIPAGLHWPLPENDLRRTLLNLILNSREAIGDRSGTITITARQAHEHLLLDLCDDGPGFPEAVLSGGIRTFKTGRPEGTGLGLVAVQRFVNELQGRLQLHNVEPHGACVTLLIPRPGAV